MLKITGIKDMAVKLRQLQKVIDDLNRPVVVPNFNNADPISIQVAIANVEQQIDDRVLVHGQNKVAASIAMKFKEVCRNNILSIAWNEQQENKGDVMNDQNSLRSKLKELDNLILDMQLIDQQSAYNFFKTLAHILHSESLNDFTNALASETNLEIWIENGKATQSSMMGSASLDWPVEINSRLGLVIAFIDQVASKKISFEQFAITFYYNGTNVNSIYKRLVTQMINPFARDYSQYVINKLGIGMSDKRNTESPAVNQHFNFHNSNVGSVQTGDHAVANITMQNSSVEITELLKALEEVTSAISKTISISEHEKQEILEIVEETKLEVAKEKRNSTKIKTYLSTIGGTLEAVGALKETYNLLAGMAGAAGYPLPQIT